MDGECFDNLTRGLADGLSRRRALRLLGGGLTAAALALGGRGSAAAKKPACTTDADCAGHGKKSVCGPDGRCVKPTVCDVTEAPTCNPPCSTPQCDAASGIWGCLQAADGVACEALGTSCGVCNAGQCLYTCGPCSTCGSAGCIADPTKNGDACYGGGTCCSGSCCAAGQECCGGCQPACPSGKVRNMTTCACECPAGTTDCGGACVDTNSDPNNCGACGNACTDPLYPDCLGGLCGCPSNTSCNYGGQSWCCTDWIPNGACCCAGRITWPTTGQEVCNPCAPGDTFCHCNDGIGGWTCCANGCGGCTGGGNSGLARCA